MSSIRRWRLLTGAGLLVLAAVVGVIGWYKLSDEPLLNRQLPYFASTGIAVMILAIAGGSLLVAEQMRTDDRRLDELEDAMRALAEAVAPSVEKAPRLRTPVAATPVAATPVALIAETAVAEIRETDASQGSDVRVLPISAKVPAKKTAAKQAPPKKVPAKKA